MKEEQSRGERERGGGGEGRWRIKDVEREGVKWRERKGGGREVEGGRERERVGEERGDGE